MEEIQPKVAVAGTVTKKAVYKPTEENLSRVICFVNEAESPVTNKDIEQGLDLPMFEVSMALMSLLNTKILKKDAPLGSKQTYSIYIHTDEEKTEVKLLPSNTRGPSPKKSFKNYAKYAFEGNNYGKGKLVLALVKSFVLKNPELGVGDIQSAFPKKLHGKFNVIEEIKGAITKTDKQRRFFLDPNQVIVLTNDCKIAVCSQWGSNNIDNVINHVISSFGFEIIGNDG